MLFCHIKLFKPYANYFYDKIQDVFSLVSIDEFTSAMRGYKNSLDERFLRELSVPDRIGKNQKSSFSWSFIGENNENLIFELCGGKIVTKNIN